MALKYKYAKREEVPAEVAGFYVEREGAFVLDAEGVVDKAKHEEFRANNITLANQLKRFEGIDPEQVRELAAEKARLEEEQRLKEGKFSEVLAEKVKSGVMRRGIA